jgi:hypothetical protein
MQLRPEVEVEVEVAEAPDPQTPAPARTNKSAFSDSVFESAERHFRILFQRVGFLISVGFSPCLGALLVHIRAGGKEKERRSELLLFIYKGTN